MQDKHHRSIQSFVRRERRMTEARAAVFNDLWAKYNINWESFNSPIILEIGFGNGEALIASALKYPEQNYLGIEVYRSGIEKLLLSVDEHQLTNVLVCEGDALLILQKHIPDKSLTGVRLFFPDPWSKRRHHKRRLVNEAFLELLAQKLLPGGYFHFATDWEDYAEWVLKVVAQSELQFDLLENPQLDRIITKFAQTGIDAGREIYDLVFALIST